MPAERVDYNSDEEYEQALQQQEATLPFRLNEAQRWFRCDSILSCLDVGTTTDDSAIHAGIMMDYAANNPFIFCPVIRKKEVYCRYCGAALKRENPKDNICNFCEPFKGLF